ncbi:hypothetical protein RBB50_007875 [Rhinocladiella similis]
MATIIVQYIERRRPRGTMGYLNYPPEILDKIYREIFVDLREILVFFCSTDPLVEDIRLKRFIRDAVPWLTPNKVPAWSDFDNELLFIESTGLSAQFLRVCKQVWEEGRRVLYGSLRWAVRWTPF